MTSINAMKFDEMSGACVFDEERGWNDEGMKIQIVEKMRPISPDKVVEETGLVAVYGNTGTSTIGDELRFGLRQRLGKEYDKACAAAGGPAKEFFTIADLAKMAFDFITNMKHTHIDQELEGRYGFGTRDFVAGAYTTTDGKRVEISDSDLVGKLDELVTWKARGKPSMSLFLNGGIIAGFEPREGFRIFRVDMIEHVLEPVQEVFLADGSGRDMVTVCFTEFVNTRSLPERRGKIDRVEGIMEMIHALNVSMLHNIGVSGYPNIICMDGRKPKNADKIWSVNDHRAKLAAEIVLGMDEGFVPRRKAAELVEGLVFEGAGFSETEQSFMKAANDHKAMARFLRGYRK